MEEKINIIQHIVEFHPACGTKMGWSTYTGGMADTGYWYWEKMVKVENETLKSFLDELIAERDKPAVIPSEEEIEKSKILIRNAYGVITTQWQKEQIEKYYKEQEYKAMFGK